MKATRRLFIINGHVRKVNAVCLFTSAPHNTHIDLSKPKALTDEKVQITVCGLGSGQKITLQAFLKESDKTFGACGHYVADSNGCVNTFKDMSYGGTFEGVEPMGLFWSMKTTPGVKPGRLVKSDVMVPFDVTVAVQDGFQEFEDLQWSDNFPSLASCILQRTYAAPGIKRIPVSEDGLYGTLFLPPGDGPFPAVIDLFGLTGGILEFRSALLASHGFASFVIAYVAHKDLPKKEWQLDFNYFLRAFDWLASHPSIDPKKLGGVSTCVGGGYLQFIASMRPAMKCLATVNSTGLPVGSEQVVEGEHIDAKVFNMKDIKIVEDMVSSRDLFLDKDGVKFCPSWRHGAKHLSVHGLDDYAVHPEGMQIFFSKVPEEFKKNYTFLCYPGAGHLLEPPYSPLCRYHYNAVFETKMLLGGEPKLHAKAQEDSWPKILEFLRQNLQTSELQSLSVQM